MALFNKLDKPIFLKEESELKVYISKLQDLYNKSQGGFKYKIEKELKIATMGEFGESNIGYELKNSNIPMYILRDITLEIGDLSAQIDYIVVTRKMTFIIECKNLIGNIEIDSQGNFVRTYNFNGRYIKEGIYSPITQNQRHLDIIKKIKKESKSNIIMKMLVEKFFHEKYKAIVVLANPKTYLNYKFAKKEVKDKVIKADQLIDFIKKSNAAADIKPLNDEDLKKSAESFLMLHRGDKPSFLKRYRELLNEFNSYNFESMDSNNSISNTENGSYTSNEVNCNNNFQEINKNNFNCNVNFQCANKKKLNDNGNILNKGTSINIPENNIVGVSVNNIDKEYFIKKLKDFRLQMSRAENSKPYYIFSDKQMLNLIEKMPKTKEELKGVSGFGDIKVSKYGDDILKIINFYEN